MDETIIREQIEYTQQLITNLREVILKVSQNPRKSFTYDTSQSSETVAYKDLTRLRDDLKDAIGELQTWNDLLNGMGDPTYSQPAFG